MQTGPLQGWPPGLRQHALRLRLHVLRWEVQPAGQRQVPGQEDELPLLQENGRLFFLVTLKLPPYSQPLYGHILQGACKPDSKYFSGTVDDCPFSCTDGSCKRGGNAKCQDKSYGCSVYKQQVDYEQFNIIQRSIMIKNFYNIDSLFELISPQCWITNIFWITPCVI